MVDALRKLSTSYACPILHGLFEMLPKQRINAMISPPVSPKRSLEPFNAASASTPAKHARLTT